jgi:hypothetical protein
VRGTLTIDARQPQWHASIAGFQVFVQQSDGRVTFSLPDGAGEFRGSLDHASKIINGEWVQPAGVVNNNRYATPVTLVAVGPFVWRGEVIPLDDRVSFYVSIQPQPGGSLTAVIVNPKLLASACA